MRKVRTNKGLGGDKATMKIQNGGPKLVAGTVPTIAAVKRDGLGLSEGLMDSIGNAIDGVTSLASSTIHNSAFPNKQDKKYKNKVADDDWKNSSVRKKLLALEKDK